MPKQEQEKNKTQPQEGAPREQPGKGPRGEDQPQAPGKEKPKPPEKASREKGRSKSQKPRRFQRFRQKRMRRRPRKPLALGVGALAKRQRRVIRRPQKKRPAREATRPKKYAAPSLQGGLSGVGRTAEKAKSKEDAAKRLVKDGRELAQGSSREQEARESPEQYAIDALEEKGEKSGGTATCRAQAVCSPTATACSSTTAMGGNPATPT